MLNRSCMLKNLAYLTAQRQGGRYYSSFFHNSSVNATVKELLKWDDIWQSYWKIKMTHFLSQSTVHCNSVCSDMTCRLKYTYEKKHKNNSFTFFSFFVLISTSCCSELYVSAMFSADSSCSSNFCCISLSCRCTNTKVSFNALLQHNGNRSNYVTITHIPVLTAIFQVNLAAPLIFSLQSSLSWVTSQYRPRPFEPTWYFGLHSTHLGLH